MKTKNFFNKKTVLVLGGAGFIGSNFIHRMFVQNQKVKIVCFDKLTYAGNLDNLKEFKKDKRFVFVKGDITDKKKVLIVFKKFKPDYVINFAAETHVDRSIHGEADNFVRTNINGVKVLLDAVHQSSSVKKFLQVSTDEVYGSLSLSEKRKFLEGDSLAPNSPYAATKASGDLLCRAYVQTFSTPVIVTRCSNNYGPYQYPEKLIPLFIARLLEEKRLPMYGNGKNVRDWIHVFDHCDALMLLLAEGRVGEVYNIGGNSELTNLKIAEYLLKFFKKNSSEIEFVADRPGHDLRYAIDYSKIQKELGWEPAFSFSEGFPQTIQWYVDNKKWMDAVILKNKTVKKI